MILFSTVERDNKKEPPGDPLGAYVRDNVIDRLPWHEPSHHMRRHWTVPR